MNQLKFLPLVAVALIAVGCDNAPTKAQVEQKIADVVSKECDRAPGEGVTNNETSDTAKATGTLRPLCDELKQKRDIAPPNNQTGK